MDRRTFVVSTGSLCTASVLSGCLGDDDSEEQSQPDTDGSPLRELSVDGDNLLVEREGLVTENGTAYVSLSVKNTGQSPRGAEIELQMRDENGDPVGSVYSDIVGPIEPQETVTVQIDIDEAPDEVGGYRLDVTERTT